MSATDGSVGPGDEESEENFTSDAAVALKYPEPRLATVKQLYATAFRCAYPGCTKPLYSQDNDTGDWILSSRISHIHAKSRGGPRWIDMPAEENRGYDNLLLLCLDHATEIDDFPSRFPAELLREWKRTQVEEFQRLRRNWKIGDDQAQEVLDRSDSFERLHVPAVVELVRRVESLRLRALRARQLPLRHARQWQTLREQTRAHFGPAWDEHGNLLPNTVEPPKIETDSIWDALLRALEDAQAMTADPAHDALSELAAVRVTDAAIAPWCDELERSISVLQSESSRWHLEPDDYTKDTAFAAAATSLADAISALTRVAKGEVETPPVAPVVELAIAPVDHLADHRRVLESARPWIRVKTRPYDPDLHERLVAATVHPASLIPPVVSNLATGMDTTAALAAAVARNASPAEKMDLVEEYEAVRPLCAAVALLRAASLLAVEQGQEEVVDAVHESVMRLWQGADLTTPEFWRSNRVHGRALVGTCSSVTSAEEARARISQALLTDPSLRDAVLLACAGWDERRQRDDLTRVAGVDRTYRDVPVWLPVDDLLALDEDAGDTALGASPDAHEVLASMLRRVVETEHER
ncbi:hypothetical protein [Cellulomonas endometrii]|uniref:hypothetical protein n=1 Tax=Cellulomonas endometrii TaxID=3036301 RepID=UPI0024ADE35E|nr:hypothetical protein [Cellulomonas endometrii]